MSLASLLEVGTPIEHAFDFYPNAVLRLGSVLGRLNGMRAPDFTHDVVAYRMLDTTNFHIGDYSAPSSLTAFEPPTVACKVTRLSMPVEKTRLVIRLDHWSMDAIQQMGLETFLKVSIRDKMLPQSVVKLRADQVPGDGETRVTVYGSIVVVPAEHHEAIFDSDEFLPL